MTRLGSGSGSAADAAPDIARNMAAEIATTNVCCFIYTSLPIDEQVMPLRAHPPRGGARKRNLAPGNPGAVVRCVKGCRAAGPGGQRM
ncbi:hypothetical protein GCM10011394_03420 [Luteimonas terricola]|uniref:Uncharacterized protein n=1 Tax=Luteimonas terricola TaxID=645597 RepID=A0ABQ2E626_9GAMM|nr:hypothetical protein GCM10011394_03420 [Luteimonas terricola]